MDGSGGRRKYLEISAHFAPDVSLPLPRDRRPRNMRGLREARSVRRRAIWVTTAAACRRGALRAGAVPDGASSSGTVSAYLIARAEILSPRLRRQEEEDRNGGATTPADRLKMSRMTGEGRPTASNTRRHGGGLVVKVLDF